METYKSLFRRSKEQPAKECFAHFSWDTSQNETWEAPFERLSRLAKPENWDFRSPQFKRNSQFPILTNYLNYTFLRVQQLNLMNYSSDGSKACFNIGLQTKEEKDIFATFYRNKNSRQQSDVADWMFYTFADTYSDKLKDFVPLPDIAGYITDPSDLIFDTSYEIDVNFEHIVDQNLERLPEVLQQNRKLSTRALKLRRFRVFDLNHPHPSEWPAARRPTDARDCNKTTKRLGADA